MSIKYSDSDSDSDNFAIWIQFIKKVTGWMVTVFLHQTPSHFPYYYHPDFFKHSLKQPIPHLIPGNLFHV